MIGAPNAIGGACPSPSDPINADRPGVTNSSTVVPYGSFEAESGSDWTVSHGIEFSERKQHEAASRRLRLHRISDRRAQLHRLAQWPPAVGLFRRRGLAEASVPRTVRVHRIQHVSDRRTRISQRLRQDRGSRLPTLHSSSVVLRSSRPLDGGRDVYAELVPERISKKSNLWAGHFAWEAIFRFARQYQCRIRRNVRPSTGRCMCSTLWASGVSRIHNSSTSRPASDSTATQSIISSASAIHSASTDYSEIETGCRCPPAEGVTHCGSFTRSVPTSYRPAGTTASTPRPLPAACARSRACRGRDRPTSFRPAPRPPPASSARTGSSAARRSRSR